MSFLRMLFTFSLGVYTGIYTKQNYDVPKIDSPKELYEHVICFIYEQIDEYTISISKNNCDDNNNDKGGNRKEDEEREET
ncbi:unnamed protein product [Rotaria socialis]